MERGAPSGAAARSADRCAPAQCRRLAAGAVPGAVPHGRSGQRHRGQPDAGRRLPEQPAIQRIIIDDKTVGTLAPPTLPGANNLGQAAGNFATITGSIGEFDVNAVVRALAQKSGTDLLSAPRVTVLSGSEALITVAQEMRYPQSFGEIQSQVGSGRTTGDGSSGSAGVAITAGTPKDFTTRKVGMELRVIPTVEEDDYSISLELNPKVTEFEGFMEYGGPSIAISGGRTVTVPPGFFQPIFSVREVSTRVTIWDGATIVMGGLTREEVKKVEDKVPILGDIPLLGRAFPVQGREFAEAQPANFRHRQSGQPRGRPEEIPRAGPRGAAANRRAEPRRPAGGNGSEIHRIAVYEGVSSRLAARMAKWLLVDGFNVAYRCFFAVPELTRADGFPTNAVHGWVKSLWRLMDQERPAATLVFFDLGGAQDRLVLLPEYKAQREEMPEALVKQLPYIKAVTRAMGLVGVEKAGMESDDLVASQAVRLAAEGHEVLIVSSDKDFAQIVGDRIKMLLPPPSANPKLGWRRLDAAGVKEKFGVPPAQIPDYLALVGDARTIFPESRASARKTFRGRAGCSIMAAWPWYAA